MQILLKIRHLPFIRFIRRHILPFLLGFSVLLHLGNMDAGHNWGGDFASYLRQAYCIADGSFEPFLSQNTFTILESDVQTGPIAYPWGYPLLLVPSVFLARENLFLMKLPTVFCFLGFLLGLCFLFRDRLKRIDLLLLLAVFAFSPVLATHSNDINSDTAFLGFAFISLLLGRRCLETDSGRKNLLLCAFTGSVVGYAMMIRMNGAALLFALISAFWADGFRKNRNFGPAAVRSAAAILGAGLTVLIFRWIFPSGEASHIAFLIRSLSWESLLKHIRFYAFDVWIAWFHAGYKLPAMLCFLLWAAGLAMLFRGIAESFRKRMPETVLLGAFAAATLGIYMIWPVLEIRFVYPLLPLLLYWILCGIRSFDRLRRCALFSPACRMVVVLLIGIGLALGVFRSARLRLKGNPLKCAAYTPQSQRLYEFIRKNTPPDAVILFFKPRVMTLQTGRRSLYLVRMEHLNKGDYYCFTDDFQDDSASLLQSRQLEECYRDEPFRLFRIHKKPGVKPANPGNKKK